MASNPFSKKWMKMATIRRLYDNSKYEEEKAKLPALDGKHCVICGAPLPKYKRKYCSNECFLNWFYGIPVKSWDNVREMVLKRDNYRCQDCGRDGTMTRLEVHHIIPLKNDGEEFNRDNCITLCRVCHALRHHVEKPPRAKPNRSLNEF